MRTWGCVALCSIPRSQKSAWPWKGTLKILCELGPFNTLMGCDAASAYVSGNGASCIQVLFPMLVFLNFLVSTVFPGQPVISALEETSKTSRSPIVLQEGTEGPSSSITWASIASGPCPDHFWRSFCNFGIFANLICEKRYLGVL